MTRYALERVGSLLLTKAAASGPAGVKVIRLLIDTGSVYTILPGEVLESSGCRLSEQPRTREDHYGKRLPLGEDKADVKCPRSPLSGWCIVGVRGASDRGERP